MRFTPSVALVRRLMFNVQDSNLILITTIKKINSSFVIKYILLRIGTPVKVAGLNQSMITFVGKHF